MAVPPTTQAATTTTAAPVTTAVATTTTAIPPTTPAATTTTVSPITTQPATTTTAAPTTEAVPTTTTVAPTTTQAVTTTTASPTTTTPEPTTTLPTQSPTTPPPTPDPTSPPPTTAEPEEPCIEYTTRFWVQVKSGDIDYEFVRTQLIPSATGINADDIVMKSFRRGLWDWRNILARPNNCSGQEGRTWNMLRFFIETYDEAAIKALREYVASGDLEDAILNGGACAAKVKGRRRPRIKRDDLCKDD
eukprot:jgi/Tetstr1/465008/TSEL_009739.t1